MRFRSLFLVSLAAFALLVVMGCSLTGGRLARITATPTKTLMPLFTATPTTPPTATSEPTPVPPSDTPPPTPTPIPATQTPILVTATPSPTITPPPTATVDSPTDTPVPATATPAPPTATSRPRATNTPSPPTHTPQPAVQFRVSRIEAFVDGSTGPTGFHNVYLLVVDSAGTPLDDIILEETNNQPSTQLTSGDKGPGKAEYTMYAGDYRFKVVGNTAGESFTSEETHVLSIVFGHANWDDLIRGGVCDSVTECQAMGQSHYSYNVTFQRNW